VIDLFLQKLRRGVTNLPMNMNVHTELRFSGLELSLGLIGDRRIRF
jgi:hypothetical protein